MIISQSKISLLIYFCLSVSIFFSIVATPIFNYSSILLIIIFFTTSSAIFLPGFFILFVISLLTFIGTDYDFLIHTIIFSLGVIFTVNKNLNLKYINFSITILLIFYFKFYDTSNLVASYNVVSASLSVFFILEFLYKGRISKIHILSIILIFLLLGNRSSIFFTNMLHKSSITLHYSSFPLYTIFLFLRSTNLFNKPYISYLFSKSV